MYSYLDMSHTYVSRPLVSTTKMKYHTVSHFFKLIVQERWYKVYGRNYERNYERNHEKNHGKNHERNHERNYKIQLNSTYFFARN